MRPCRTTEISLKPPFPEVGTRFRRLPTHERPIACGDAVSCTSRGRLHEEALAGVFGVSRTRIRAALQRLQHSGLVTAGKKQIARVAEPSVREARDLFATRLLIEPEIAAVVAREITASSKAALRDLVDQEHAVREGGDRMEATRLAGELHVLLAEVADNSVLLKLMREVIDRAFLVTFLYQMPGIVACVHDEHMRLLDAIFSGEPAAAAEEMRAHIRGIEARMGLEERSEPPVNLADAFNGLLNVQRRS